jgi:hypothetical protein
MILLFFLLLCGFSVRGDHDAYQPRLTGGFAGGFSQPTPFANYRDLVTNPPRHYVEPAQPQQPPRPYVRPVQQQQPRQHVKPAQQQNRQYVRPAAAQPQRTPRYAQQPPNVQIPPQQTAGYVRAPQNTGTNEYKIVDFSWQTNVTNIFFCLEPNGYEVLPELYLTVFDMYNSILISPFQQDATGLKLLLTNPQHCESNRTHTIAGEVINKLTFGPTKNGASAVTERKFASGTAIDRRITLFGGDVVIDTRVLQSAGLFYNVLLHEVGHVLGLDHTVSTETVMGHRIRASVQNEVIQQENYLVLEPGDVRGIHAVLARDKPAYAPPFITKETYQFVPSYPAKKHASGTYEFVLLDKIYRHDKNTNNNVEDFWIRVVQDFIPIHSFSTEPPPPLALTYQQQTLHQFQQKHLQKHKDQQKQKHLRRHLQHKNSHKNRQHLQHKDQRHNQHKNRHHFQRHLQHKNRHPDQHVFGTAVNAVQGVQRCNHRQLYRRLYLRRMLPLITMNIITMMTTFK